MKFRITLLAVVLTIPASALGQIAPRAGQGAQSAGHLPSSPNQSGAQGVGQAPPQIAAKVDDNLAAYIKNQVRTVMGHAMQGNDLQKFMDTFEKRFSASAPSSAVTDAMVPIYDRAFSLEEIQGLINFYESPLGQHVVKVLPQVTRDTQEAGMKLDQSAAMQVLRGMSDEYPELKRMLPPVPGASPAPGAAPAPAPKPSPSPEQP